MRKLELLYLAGVAIAGLGGFGLGLQQVSPPKTVYVDRPVIQLVQVDKPYPVPQIEYIDKPVIVYQDKIIEKTVQVPVEKIVIVNKDWRQFPDEPALVVWAQEHLVNMMPPADCDEYASIMQMEAFRDGYLMSIQWIDNGMLGGHTVSDVRTPHMGNLAILDTGWIYFIEPQPGMFRIVRVGQRD
jgi:hypothetical protein